jgi:hypothetical protein
LRTTLLVVGVGASPAASCIALLSATVFVLCVQRSTMSAVLIVRFMSAGASEREEMQRLMPSMFTDDVVFAISEAAAVLEHSGGAADDVFGSLSAVSGELELAPEALPGRDDATAVSQFEETLRQLLVHCELVDDEADADAVEVEVAWWVGQPAHEQLVAVLPLVAEFAGTRAALWSIAASGRVWRAAVCGASLSRGMWLGMCMREFPEQSRTFIANRGPEEAMAADWRGVTVHCLTHPLSLSAS